MTNITLTNIPLNGGETLPIAIALDSEGAKIVFNETDTKTLILVENTASTAQSITFKMGTGLQGVVDMVHSLPANETTGFVLESGAFKNKGFVYATGASTLKIAAIVLP